MNLFNRIKFAAAVFDNNPEVQKLYKSGQLKLASEIDQPAKRPDVETMEAINAFMKRNPVEKAGGGMLVQPSIDGSRPGYASDYSPEERKQQAERGERIYKIKDGRKTLDLNKEQKKWFNKTHKNNPNSRYYKKDWDDLGGKKADLLDSYFNELKREKPPKGYITTKEFSKKYGFPIYEKRQYGPVTKTESNYINNALMKKITAKDADRGRKNLFLQKFLKETLEPKQFDTVLDLGDGKKSVKKVNYVKDNAEIAKKVRTYVDSPSIDPKTIQNMNLVLSNNKIKTLFNRGDYKGIVKALGQIENLTNAERANVMLRVAQAMSGVNFRDFKHNIKTNKISAKKIFKGLEKGRAGIPNEYNDAYKRLKHNTIKDAIGLDYFTKTYQGFIDDARSALKKAGIDITNLDLNEITGLSSGYKNQTFSSTQFVNFMDTKFNQGAHASMIGEYSRYENALKTALKNGTVNFKNQTFTPRQLINNWQQWRSDWYDRLDDKYKTKAVRDILPTFTLGKDPYSSAISKKRLVELSGLGLNLQEEGIKSGYAKTFPTIGKQPVLKEVVDMKPAQIKKIISAIGCDPKASGGRVGYNEGEICFKKGVDTINNNKIKTQAQAKNFEKLLKTTRNITKYGIIPEALFVTGESLIRMGLGDNPKEALLQALEYLLPGDQTKIANRSMYTRLLNENAANILERVNTYKNAQNKLENIKQQKENASNLTTTSDLDYFTQTQKDVDKYYNPLIKKQEAEIEKFKRPSAEMIYAKRMQDEATDIRTANNAITKLKKLSKDMEMDDEFSNIEQLQAPSVKVDATLFPDYRKAMSSDKARNELQFMSFPDEVIKEFAKENNMNADELLLTKDALKQIYSIDNAANVFGPEQVYGASGTVGTPIDLDMSNLTEPTSSRYEGFSPRFNTYNPMAGGGIAGLSGGDKSGPAPESGPQSQGLQGLMNRVKNR